MNPDQPTASISLTERGKLPAERTAELLVTALNDGFDGSLFVTNDSAERVAFRFRGGLVTRWHSVEGHDLVLEALAELLPPEQITLVQGHAQRRGTDELGAVQELCLLSDTALYRLHRECLTRELQRIMKSSQTLGYRFAAGSDCFEGSLGLEMPIEPLGVIADALVQAPNLDFCRGRLQATRHLPLFLRGSAAGSNVELRGGARQVIQSLKRLPESFETLRLRNLVPEATLVATVYALWATNSVELSGHARSAPPRPAAHQPDHPKKIQKTLLDPARAGTSERRTAPQANVGAPRAPHRSGEYRITSGSLATRADPHAGLPCGAEATEPGPASGGLTHGSRPSKLRREPHVKSAQELSAESKALDAWLRAVDEPALAPRALKLVEKAADYFPTNSSILFYLGCLLTMSDRSFDGEAVIRHLLKLDPGHLEAQNELERIKKINRNQSKVRPTTLLDRWGIRRSV